MKKIILIAISMVLVILVGVLAIDQENVEAPVTPPVKYSQEVEDDFKFAIDAQDDWIEQTLGKGGN